ncbi:hypothetical protein DYQ86_24835 [Acidobacteria bacterium AB60]|nr:hypothetical protein DYQ86_24835 [Acidobacteria bacterium AB60]
MIKFTQTALWFGAYRGVVLFCLIALPVVGVGQATGLPAGVEKVCSIKFDKDTKRPARVQDDALPCLKDAVRKLRANPNAKLVLVGQADSVKDHEADENGHMRDTEDPTGLDVRWEDLAAYRSLNTKWYLTRWLGIEPARVLPTTDESIQGQEVTFYLVPGEADFNHNYLDTTKTNERPCTVKPCYSSDEESLKAQPRSRIPETAVKTAGK